jgi:hypothetical protein
MCKVVVLVCVCFLLGDASLGKEPAAVPKLGVVRLAEIFLTNEADADENYVGKEMQVSGRVVRVSRSESGRVSVKDEDRYVLELDLENANRGGAVEIDIRFFFDGKHRAQLARLKPGQSVIVRGTCGSPKVWSADAKKREADYMRVELRNCTLVATSRDTPRKP